MHMYCAEERREKQELRRQTWPLSTIPDQCPQRSCVNPQDKSFQWKIYLSKCTFCLPYARNACGANCYTQIISTPVRICHVSTIHHPQTPTIKTKNTHLSHPLAHRGPPKRMCLSIENPTIQVHHIGLTKNQVKILQRLRRPETLHLILHIAFARCLGSLPP